MMYFIVIAIISVVILLSLGKIPTKFNWIGILFISAVLVYSTTLLGSDVVGSDIHKEILVSRDALNGAWNLFSSEGQNQNSSSLLLSVVAPFLSVLLSMDIIWIYKIVIPIFLIFVPLILYYVFSKQIGEQKAFFSSLFFMFVPVFNLEIASIAKTMLAELLFAVMMLIMISDWKQMNKVIGIMLCLLGMIVSHYTVALAAITYLLGILLIQNIFKRWSLFSSRKVSDWSLIFVVMVGIVSFGVYYQYASGGSINGVLIRIFNQFFVSSSALSDVVSKPESLSLAQIAMGGDFWQVSIWGKFFRVLQFLSQFMIIIGVLAFPFIYKKYRFTSEFISGIGCSVILLFCCVFLPNFADIINMTRFYHISLFFLAPCFVISWDFLSNLNSNQTEYEDVTQKEFDVFWMGLNEELVTFDSCKEDLVLSSVFIKGVHRDGALAGVGGLYRSFGQFYTFHLVKAKYHKRGCSGEITEAFIKYARRKKVHVLLASVFPWNVAIVKATEKQGYKFWFEGETQRWLYFPITDLGEIFAKILRPLIQFYLSPVMTPARFVRYFLKERMKSKR